MSAELLNTDIFLDVSLDLLRKGRSVRFEARGRSMNPIIHNGDFVTIAPLDNESITKGDVVLHRGFEARVLVHRILKIFQDKGTMMALITGDATVGKPDTVPFGDILGRVTKIERKGFVKHFDTIWYKRLSRFIVFTSPAVNYLLPFLIRGKRKLLGTR